MPVMAEKLSARLLAEAGFWPRTSTLDALLHEAARVVKAVEDAKPEITYEVWQDGMWVAGSDSESDARHYAMMYAQDGPVTLVKATTYREEVADGRG